jgi:hypothetical protein
MMFAPPVWTDDSSRDSSPESYGFDGIVSATAVTVKASAEL